MERTYIVGTGSQSFWHRRTNTYPGCTCPPWRYNPMYPKPTNPECEKHGMASTSQPPRRDLYEIEQETQAAAERLFSCPDKDEE
jgi:hypothetical protein